MEKKYHSMDNQKHSDYLTTKFFFNIIKAQDSEKTKKVFE